MPNVKRIRQDQEAAQKRYATYADQIAAYNANVDQVNAANQSANDLYNSQAAEYDAFVNAMQGGQTTGLVQYEPGKWATVSGNQFTETNKRGVVQNSGAIYDSLEAAGDPAANGGTVWVKNPDGTASSYRGGHTGWGAPVEGGPLDEWGQPAQTPQYGWVATSGPVRVAQFNTPTPAPQEVTTPTPEEPKGWNPSLRELGELQAPTTDAAGAQMATARGEGAKTGLVNEAAGRDSAFADPEDPNNLADRGILARVLGGQL